MDRLWHLITADSSSAALVAATIAVIGVFISAFVSATVARRATYIATVTTERSKWIEKLRNNIGRLVSLLHTVDREIYRDDKFSDSEGFGKLSGEIVETMVLIRLQLNPGGRIDANVLALLRAAQDHIGEQDYKKFERVFVRHIQWLLKEEWEKVKYEAKGPFGKLLALFKGWRRRVAYQRFCADGDALSDWVTSN